MARTRLLGCALNFSEGRRPEVIDAVASAAGSHSAVVDVSSDPDHHRTVITLAGNPESLLEGVLAATETAVGQIDLREHRGVHPRLGAVDVIPFTPWRNTSMREAAGCALDCCQRIWEKLRVPCFLYELAAPSSAKATSLPWLRLHAFEDLLPDCGGAGPHATAGATAVGARAALAAFNVNLASYDLTIARSIASEIRKGTLGRDKGVRALGLPLESRRQVQISTNITRPDTTEAIEVVSRVEELAGRYGVSIMDTEFVGLAPRKCLGQDVGALRLSERPRILEEEIERIYASLP